MRLPRRIVKATPRSRGDEPGTARWHPTWHAPWAWLLSAALPLLVVAAMLPAPTAGATSPPTTSVLVPSNGTTLTGTTPLDASASNANSVEFLLLGGSFGFSGKVLCTATLTAFGWVCTWNTATVPNGSYALVSEATNASGSTFGTAGIVVDNPRSATTVLVPSKGATVTGSTTLDATAANANSVEFLLFGGSFGFSGQVLCSATLTAYGWVCTWNTATVPVGTYTLVSAASNPSGSTFSAGISITVYQVTNYSAPSIEGPSGITVGPDGALWFPNFGNDSIGRITTAGVVSNYTDPSIVNPGGITAGPDGALWFTNEGTETETGAVGVSIGRITTAGAVTDYTATSMAQPFVITVGPDQALWFTNLGNGSIGRITTAGVLTNYFAPDTDPTGITTGPDGALWFTNFENNSIGRITTEGVVTTFTAPSISHPDNISAGPDGALWFTNSEGNSIGRITTAGVVTNYTAPTIDRPEAITAGPDGALWFNNALNNSIGRITTSGVVTDYSGPAIDVPGASIAGPDGALWFTNSGKQAIGRLTPP
jgi:streptogramin lyase